MNEVGSDIRQNKSSGKLTPQKDKLQPRSVCKASFPAPHPYFKFAHVEEHTDPANS